MKCQDKSDTLFLLQGISLSFSILTCQGRNELQRNGQSADNKKEDRVTESPTSLQHCLWKKKVKWNNKESIGQGWGNSLKA